MVLSNINITVERGRKVALVGESGTGKHVLIDLLLGIYSKNSEVGKMRLLEQDSRLINARKLREKVCYLAEFPVLFSGTYRDNIDPKKEFTDEEIFWCVSRLEIFSKERTSEENSQNDSEKNNGQNNQPPGETLPT